MWAKRFPATEASTGTTVVNEPTVKNCWEEGYVYSAYVCVSNRYNQNEIT